jgi:hypothetical protein
MNRRTNVLRMLRRRSASVGRVVLAWFALATFGAGAAPCYAMTVGSPATHAAPAQAASGHQHSHSAMHDRAGPAVAGGELPSTACPHCPLSVGMASSTAASSHALCAAGDEVADGGKAPLPVPMFKHVAALVVGELPPLDPGPRPAWSQRRPSGAAGTAVALNLRYCVLLI